MAKHSLALKFLLSGLDFPDSHDPSGFGREDVEAQLQVLGLKYKDTYELFVFLHSPDYSRAKLARRLRALH